ncbi:hypothetical protein NP233_g6019 [Leucocoprinus birnbaumii]|uniref:Gag-like protein n=1 Tax=Leucocoprinus birnbaumii TaxID=56174 RepID=A0AAD5VRS3_9AGAR|nr:hypothetical protein NP233_g6019 [Leucocoprinus birnbaumii]
MDVAGKLPCLTEAFDTDSSEARPGNRIMDVFSNRISFHPRPNDCIRGQAGLGDDTPWSDNPLDIIGSPSPPSSIVEGSILCRSVRDGIAVAKTLFPPKLVSEKARASPAASVASTSYAADYSPTKDKTASMIRRLNNLNKTLHMRLFVLVDTAVKVPGVLGSTVSSNGTSFGEGMAHAFYGFLDCQTAGTATPTRGTADMSSDVNMDSEASPGPDSASMSDGKSASKPIWASAPAPGPPPAWPPRSPCCPPPPPKQQSYAAVAKSALSLVKLTKTMPDLKLERIVAMRHTAEPSPDKRRKVKSTTPSPSCRKILVPLKDHIPSMTSFPLLITEINRALAKQSLRIESIIQAYEGILLSANQVATDEDLVIITASIRKVLNSPGAQASLPWSKSYIKILDVPHFIGNGSSRVAITPTVIRDAMLKSPMASSFDLASTPRVMRASPTSNTSIVWVNLHDSQSGANVKALVGKSLQIGVIACPIRAARANPGTPQCQRCWRWGHTTNTWWFFAPRCPICSGPHCGENHRDHAACCKAKPKAKPPVAVTPPGEPCPHGAHCINCGKTHPSNDHQCPFWCHRFDRPWIERCYSEKKSAT